MFSRSRTRLSVESLDARDLPDATPVAAVAGALPAGTAYSATSVHVLDGPTTQDRVGASDFLADDIQFAVAQRVESFAIRYTAEVPVTAVVTFHSVDPATGGPGAEVASFLVPNLPATGPLPGSGIQSVALPEAARFTWEPTAGIYKNYANGYWGPNQTGGFLSVRFERPDGTPFDSPTGGQVAAVPAGPRLLDNLAAGTGTLAGVWDLRANAINANFGGVDYQPHSLWLQVGARPADAPPVGTPRLTGFTLSADTVRGGQSVTGTLTLSAAAPAGGLFVRLASDRAAVSAPVVFVPAGATSVTFTLGTARVAADTLATITATVGDVTLSDRLTVTRRR